jgi:ribosomal-protein-serine acetyltransferase
MLICSAGDGIEVHLLQERHAEELLGLAEGWEPKPQVNEWLFPGNSPDAARAYIRGHLERFSRGRGFAAGVWLEEHLVGVICLKIGGVLGVDVPRPVTASIDYALAPAARGTGIMTKACAAVIGYAFANYPLNRIEITPDVANPKSCAIPDRLGFTKEGILRQMVLTGTSSGISRSILSCAASGREGVGSRT